MPFIPESPSRRSWRKQVVDYLVDRVDEEGWIRFRSRAHNARREMLKVAEMLPRDIMAEIFEDPNQPGTVYLELRLAPAPIQLDTGFRIVQPDQHAYDYEIADPPPSRREVAGW
jgi:hypothetical protein